ncbi:MAG TPA: hypothetical protein VFO34_13265, partial [Candidatus Acidoferrales bacterium]|nr:hypothetical protein [Candidatus Acidoferrales bacterium]
MNASSTTKLNLLGRPSGELSAIAARLSEPAYRGKQLCHALYAERRFDLAAMSNLPAAFRERLAAEYIVALPEIVRRFQSSDGSVRYLLAVSDDGA